MPTIKHRINISLSRTAERTLVRLAKRERVPLASAAARLLEHALEVEEDEVWDMLVNTRDTKNAKFVAHQDAWAL